jgi:hypothetical protein
MYELLIAYGYTIFHIHELASVWILIARPTRRRKVELLFRFDPNIVLWLSKNCVFFVSDILRLIENTPGNYV